MNERETTDIALAGETLLTVRREGREDVVRLRTSQRVLVTIRVTAEGPVVEVEGAALAIRTTGELAVDAERLALHGRSGVSITSGGDVVLETAGRLSTTARSQRIEATLGDVRVEANDDVRLDGERVLVNC